MSDKFLYPHSEVAEVLSPATSFESAHVAHNYPYGSLRTDMKYWCEYRKGKGFRPVTCSLNPKTGKWNKPHAGTYTEGLVLYLEVGTNHIKFAHFTFYDDNLASEFLKTFEAGLTKEGKDILMHYIEKAKKA